MCLKENCRKRFGLRESLNKHMRMVHSNDRPFHCEKPGCDKTFGLKSGLETHIRIVHNQEKPYVCKEEGCGEKFKKKRSLNLHINKVHLQTKTSSLPVKEEAQKKNTGSKRLHRHRQFRHRLVVLHQKQVHMQHSGHDFWLVKQYFHSFLASEDKKRMVIGALVDLGLLKMSVKW